MTFIAFGSGFHTWFFEHDFSWNEYVVLGYRRIVKNAATRGFKLIARQDGATGQNYSLELMVYGEDRHRFTFRLQAPISINRYK